MHGVVLFRKCPDPGVSGFRISFCLPSCSRSGSHTLEDGDCRLSCRWNYYSAPQDEREGGGEGAKVRPSAAGVSLVAPDGCGGVIRLGTNMALRKMKLPREMASM